MRILVVDDDVLNRRGICDYLVEAGHEVVIAGNKEEALQVYEVSRPEVALVEIVIPAGANDHHYKQQSVGLDLSKALKEARPKLGIVLFSAHEDRLSAFWGLIEQNMRGLAYKLKGCPPWELMDAIQGVRSGRVLIDPDVNNAPWFITQSLSPEERPYIDRIIQNWAKLTQLQKDVARLLATGFANKAIAEEKHLAEGTVENTISQIYRTLELDNGNKQLKKVRRDVLLAKAYLIIQITERK